MLIVRSNPLGGRPLKQNRFPLGEDKQGNFGLKLGYLESGEPILISIRDAESFASQFGLSLGEYRKVIKQQKPRTPWNVWLAKILLGKRVYYRIMQEGFEEGD